MHVTVWVWTVLPYLDARDVGSSKVMDHTTNVKVSLTPLPRHKGREHLGFSSWITVSGNQHYKLETSGYRQLNKTAWSGHICFPHFHFSLPTGESQAVRAPAGDGRSSEVGYSGSSEPNDHTGHCQPGESSLLLHLPAAGIPTATRARLCVRHSRPTRLANLPKRQPGQGAVPERRVLRQGKQAVLPYPILRRGPTRAERREQKNKLSYILHQLTSAA